jgi:pimeloyl-ACP methyl ester carboxylesterase
MQSHRYLEQHGTRRELVIALHGYSKSSDRLKAVCETIADLRPDADIFAPVLPFVDGWICLQKAETIVADLMREIDQIVAERAGSGESYQSIDFVGHSFGAVLARRLVITAFGEQRSPAGDLPAPFEPELADFRAPRPWAQRITRLVLLAGMNRGWTVSSALDWITSVQWSILQFIGETLPASKPTIFAIRRGAPFLVQTRLQWLALMNPDYGPRPTLVTVQLLGSGDDQVSPDDSVDYAVDLFGSQSYFYIEVPYATHAGIVQMSKKGKRGTQSVRNIRREKFALALTAERNVLTANSVTREQMADNLPPEPDTTVTDVVFVVHGIRDKGYWTQKLARTIKKHAAAGQKFESFTGSYGYFAMLPFILRRVRQRKVEWLMDCYTEARARFPSASFHYVGHSNGTYLAAQALQDYPSARFKFIVFAGSVVRRNYGWLALTKPIAPGVKPKVERVLNYVATRDWVVALFPKGLQPWRIFNLGSAGHDGFREASPQGPVYEVRYIPGGHGAGHEEPNWDDIARFVASGNPPARSFAKEQSRFWRMAGSVSFILFPLLCLIVLGTGGLILWSIFAQLPELPCKTIPFLADWSGCHARPGGNQEAWRSFGFVAYLWIVYLFVTRF